MFSTKDPIATKADFYSAWDAQKFYVYADVTDANKVVGYGDAGFVSWKGDGMQFYFDIYNRHFSNGVQADQLNGAAISVNMNTVVGSAENPNLTFLQKELANAFGPYANGIEFAQIKGGTSYKLEIGIPWEAFYYVVFKKEYNKDNPTPFAIKVANLMRTEIKKGKKVAMAIQINDNDGTDRKNIVTVPQTMGDGLGLYQQPAYWGELELVGNGTPFTDPLYKHGGPSTTPNAVKNVESFKVNVYTVLGCINVAGENLSSVEVYSMSGVRTFKSATDADGVTIPVHEYAKGVYFVKVTDKTNKTVSRKIVL